MSKRIEFSSEVIAFENEGDYHNAVDRTYTEWIADRSETAMLSALLEHWFVIFESDVGGKTYDQWSELLNAAFEKDSDAWFGFFLGYMMQTADYLFLGERFGTGGESADLIRKKGRELMEKAYKNHSKCAVFKVEHIYQHEAEDYTPTEKEISEIRESFPVPSVVNEFFRRVFGAEDEEQNLPKFEDFRNRAILEGFSGTQ